MKKAIILFGIVASQAHAQPVINSNDVLPVAGEIFKTVNFYDAADPGNSGANVTWDFSGIQATEDDTLLLRAVTPQSTGISSAFPGASVAIADPDDYYVFLKAENNKLSEMGAGEPGDAMPFSDNKELLRFPLTLGTTFTDTYNGSGGDVLFSIDISGKVTVTADAYGTLITPSGTFNNVLRITTIDSSTTIFSGFGFTDTTSEATTSYTWYQAGVHWPLFTINVYEDDMGTYTDGFFLHKEQPSGIFDKHRALQLNAFPNPFTEKINLEGFEAASNEKILTQFITLDGRIVKQLELNASTTLQVNVADLPAGSYIVSAQQGDKRYVRQLLKL